MMTDKSTDVQDTDNEEFVSSLGNRKPAIYTMNQRETIIVEPTFSGYLVWLFSGIFNFIVPKKLNPWERKRQKEYEAALAFARKSDQLMADEIAKEDEAEELAEQEWLARKPIDRAIDITDFPSADYLAD